MGGEQTRDAILRTAASLATADGLDGLSIGNVAAELGMSKSRLHAHFASKTELQLATVAEAARIFEAEVIQPALAAPAGLASAGRGLRGVLRASGAPYVPRRVFPGQRRAGDRPLARARSGT